MCGLIGAAIRSNAGFMTTEVAAITDLLYMDALRGMDSTGVCSVNSSGHVSVLKKATWAPSFMVSKSFMELEKTLTASGKFFMGHNRKATVGNVSSKNAHPFVIDNKFVLMHNGSLSNHKHLGAHEVDSEAIAEYLYNNWDDDATSEEKAKVLAHIGGAFALVWYDLRTEKLNIVRNAQRPLAVATSTFGNILWASDEHMLRCALARNNLSSSYTVKSLPVYSLLTHDGQELKEVALPTAPFSPVTQKTYTYIPPTGRSGGKATTNEGGMSKNQFKRFLNAHLGKKIVFSVDDFVDIHGKNSWYGEKVEWQFPHEIVGYTDDATMFDVMNNYNMAEGIVKSGFFSKEDGNVKLHVEIIGAYTNKTPACH